MCVGEDLTLYGVLAYESLRTVDGDSGACLERGRSEQVVYSVERTHIDVTSTVDEVIRSEVGGVNNETLGLQKLPVFVFEV